MNFCCLGYTHAFQLTFEVQCGKLTATKTSILCGCFLLATAQNRRFFMAGRKQHVQCDFLRHWFCNGT